MKPLAFLTKHGKLPAVQEALAEAGFSIEIETGFDTDLLGTFTGEVSRRGTQLDAALGKARQAVLSSGQRYGLGSEGSFGPDPYLGMTPWAMEVLAWWDAQTGHAVHAMVQGAETNYAQQQVEGLDAGLAFAARSRFPAHGLIVGRPGDPVFLKEVTDEAGLRSALQAALMHGPVWLETDMRAHRNPTRMTMIRRVAQRLSERLRCSCPSCGASGFGPQALLPGAFCSQCRRPTAAARARLLRCDNCGHTQEEPLRSEVSPQQCEHCNP